MKRKQFLLTLLVAIISAFLGGTLGVWFLMPPSVLAQDEPSKVIEAERFVLRDAQGRMRAELSTNFAPLPLLLFYDERGERRTTVGQHAVLVAGPDDSYVMLSPDEVQITDANGDRLRLNPDSLTISEDDGSFVSIAGGDTPRIEIIDEEGFQAVLGSTGTVETRTGKTNQTSAASLILFGKDKKVLWSAP